MKNKLKNQDIFQKLGMLFWQLTEINKFKLKHKKILKIKQLMLQRYVKKSTKEYNKWEKQMKTKNKC